MKLSVIILSSLFAAATISAQEKLKPVKAPSNKVSTDSLNVKKEKEQKSTVKKPQTTKPISPKPKEEELCLGCGLG